MIACNRRMALLIGLTLSMVLTITVTAHAEPPIKLIPSGRFGAEVDKTTKANVCTVVSKDVCQAGKTSSEPGGFEFPKGVAAATSGNLYVADGSNSRIQELKPDGEFVLMFGKEVNETKDRTPGTTEAEKGVCSEEEIKNLAVKCKKGVQGTTSGAFADPAGVAVDPSSGNVYVQDTGNQRVDEYTSTGIFVLTIGKEVNETNDLSSHASEAEKNLCTSASKDTCTTGAQASPEPGEGLEKGAFDLAASTGNLLAVGGAPGDLLYVGDHHRVQEFNSAGEWKAEIRLSAGIISSEQSGAITAIAVDGETAATFLIYNNEPVVRQYGATGKEVGSIDITEATLATAIAVDTSGHLAVAAGEYIPLGGNTRWFGKLYEANNGRLISKFSIEFVEAGKFTSIGFNAEDGLYAAASTGQEVQIYAAVHIAELIAGNATCRVGPETGTLNTFNCELKGEVEPFDVEKTTIWFEWGDTCAYGSDTAKQSFATVEELLPVSATIEGLRPNREFCYELAGEDQNVQSPETLTSNSRTFSTPIVSPQVVGGEPSASFVTGSSALFFAELNPENSRTEYYFEYAPETGSGALVSCHNARKEACPGVAVTAAGESSAYGKTGAALEVDNLQPDTLYHYRLNADNLQETKAELRAVGPEGAFTTTVAPKVEAFTGLASAITTTSALVQGSVNPDGQQATYAFELGEYQGASTRYNIVLSGSTASGNAPEAESTVLTGLQPGVTYAFRISIRSGYGSSEGAPTFFTTATLPTLLPLSVAPVQLPLPKIEFPRPSVKCKQGYALNSHKACVKLKAKPKPKAKPKRRKVKNASKKGK
jgi:NHL repeat